MDHLLVFIGGSRLGNPQNAIEVARRDGAKTIKAQVGLQQRDLEHYSSAHAHRTHNLSPAKLLEALSNICSTDAELGMREAMLSDIHSYLAGEGGERCFSTYLAFGENAKDLTLIALGRLGRLKPTFKGRKLPASIKLSQEPPDGDYVTPMIDYVSAFPIGDTHQVLTRELFEAALLHGIFEASPSTTIALTDSSLAKARGPLPADIAKLPQFANTILGLANQGGGTTAAQKLKTAKALMASIRRNPHYTNRLDEHSCPQPPKLDRDLRSPLRSIREWLRRFARYVAEEDKKDPTNPAGQQGGSHEGSSDRGATTAALAGKMPRDLRRSASKSGRNSISVQSTADKKISSLTRTNARLTSQLAEARHQSGSRPVTGTSDGPTMDQFGALRGRVEEIAASLKTLSEGLSRQHSTPTPGYATSRSRASAAAASTLPPGVRAEFLAYQAEKEKKEAQDKEQQSFEAMARAQAPIITDAIQKAVQPLIAAMAQACPYPLLPQLER